MKSRQMKDRWPKGVLCVLAMLSLVGMAPAESAKEQPRLKSKRDPEQMRRWLEREVRHELVMLPFYDVFDNLNFQLDGTHVILSGQVVRPTLKSSAEKVVKNVEGVDRVTNNIEVLPVSPNDDRIRVAVYRAIYSQSALQQYGLRAVPPIHIIVKNGNVSLEGVVSSEADKNIANIQANTVPGVFSVKNNLRVGP
ncbi:MAG: BON domain-containing protein [Acidobacteriota bacterium]